MSDAKFTPGPWFWDVRQKGRTFRLVAAHSGCLIVMDFSRWGMQSAQPRFSDRNGERRGGIMVDGSTLDLSAHPDACLIAAAPQLYSALEDLLDACDGEWSEFFDGSLLEAASAALHAARGETWPKEGEE